MKRIHAKVTGLVQGVFFRASTRDTARTLGLNGWVRNMPDGSVELEAEGPEDRISQLVIWLNQGPQYARVGNVEVKEVSVTVEDTGFHVDF
jgi:acylphosphatase